MRLGWLYLWKIQKWSWFVTRDSDKLIWEKKPSLTKEIKNLRPYLKMLFNICIKNTLITWMSIKVHNSDPCFYTALLWGRSWCRKWRARFFSFYSIVRKLVKRELSEKIGIRLYILASFLVFIDSSAWRIIYFLKCVKHWHKL